MKPASINIVIPMAGNGMRFRNAGYVLPKPLIDVRGKPMIAHILDNVRIENANIILIMRKQDAQEHAPLFEQLKAQYPYTPVLIDKLTEGAACTVLHAVSQINNDTPLLMANSDQVVDCSIAQFVQDAQDRRLDGSILTFHEAQKDPKWSYANVDANGMVLETREKVAISTHATVGIYWFAKGSYFVNAAAEMIAHNDRCNNEFYTCPAYNYLIGHGKKIGIHEIAKEQMHGLGTPEDLDVYLKRSA